ncbi:hypothetical protein A4X09_0g6666 [Tilletia walkeri]|uniref:C2H2-type domain-containing protein n=1 Tax=Tilletia walkeri TaxID=117179 RepID=A0A8X7T2E7_9BASI|nr:hypothetical protein A4X09_0g6666 [Tilletia walkeri]
MQNAPNPPARSPSTLGPAASAASAAYGHLTLSMLSSLALPRTIHATNGAPLPPFRPEGGTATSNWLSADGTQSAVGGASGSSRNPSGSGRSNPANRNHKGTGRAGTGWVPAGANRMGHYGGADHQAGMGLDADSSADSADLAGGNHADLVHAAHAAQAASSITPNGPPFVCTACKQTYSRLEYLRRHERRHADIRPFVCDCGKGFSRSDVLGRHRKQCKTVVGEDGSKGREQGGPPTKKQRRSTAGRKDESSASDPRLEPGLESHTGSEADEGRGASPTIEQALLLVNGSTQAFQDSLNNLHAEQDLAGVPLNMDGSFPEPLPYVNEPSGLQPPNSFDASGFEAGSSKDNGADEGKDTTTTLEEALLRDAGDSQEVQAALNIMHAQQALLSAPFSAVSGSGTGTGTGSGNGAEEEDKGTDGCSN